MKRTSLTLESVRRSAARRPDWCLPQEDKVHPIPCPVNDLGHRVAFHVCWIGTVVTLTLLAFGVL
jgi:hypothetical protein